MRGAIPHQQTRQYDAQPIHVPQNVGSAAPKLFVCVESPWYTATQMGLTAPHYGTVVASVALPIVDLSLKQKIDIPTELLTGNVFSQCYVTERDADNFPRRALVDYDAGQRDAAVTKLYCGPTLAGRPFRSQIVEAMPADGKWWLMGTVNPCLWGKVVDSLIVRLQDPNGYDVMPGVDPEFGENAIMPAAAFPGFGSIDIGYAVDDVVVLQWIYQAYYIIPVTCTETPI